MVSQNKGKFWLEEGGVGGGQTCSPHGLERPVPSGMLHVMYYQARARGVRPYAAPTLPAAPFLPPFPHLLRQHPGSGGGTQCPGGGRKPPFPLCMDCRTPPHRLDTGGSMAAVRGVGSSRARPIIFIKWCAGSALDPPPSMDGGAGWKVLITGINHLEDE